MAIFATLSVLAVTGVFELDRSAQLRANRQAEGPAALVIGDVALASVAPALARITVDRASGATVATAVFVRSGGQLITTSDAVANAQSITVTTFEGTSYNARVLGTDTSNDIAVLSVDATSYPTARFGEIGSTTAVFVIGSSSSTEYPWIGSASIGSLGSRIDTTDGSSLHDMFSAVAEESPPSAGSIVISSDGTILGLLTARTSASIIHSTSRSIAIPFTDRGLEITWATPAMFVEKIVSDIIATGHAHRPSLGVFTYDTSPTGVVVSSVTPNSPAELARISPGDIIVSVDNSPITSSSDLVTKLRMHSDGDIVPISIQRNNELLRLSVRVSATP